MYVSAPEVVSKNNARRSRRYFFVLRNWYAVNGEA
jgi:hypothetical protein